MAETFLTRFDQFSESPVIAATVISEDPAVAAAVERLSGYQPYTDIGANLDKFMKGTDTGKYLADVGTAVAESGITEAVEPYFTDPSVSMVAVGAGGAVALAINREVDADVETTSQRKYTDITGPFASLIYPRRDT